MRRVVLPLVALLVVGVLAWWLLREDDESADLGSAARDPQSPVANARLQPAPDAGAATTSTRAVEARREAGRVAGRVVSGYRGRAAAVALHANAAWGDTAFLRSPLDGMGAPLSTTEAGPDGHFAFPGVTPGRYFVRARTAGGERGTARVEVHTGHQIAHVLVALDGGDLELRGRIVQADGRPWRGRVGVQPPLEDRAWTLGDLATTDGEGRFRVSGLHPGKANVVAVLPGVWRRTFPALSLPHAGELELVLDDELATLTGSVVDARDETPIESAVVQCRSTAAGARLVWRTTTDRAGRFAVSRLADHTRCTAWKDGYAAHYEYPPADASELKITLAAHGRLEGRVVEAEGGAPVEGARVVFTTRGPDRVATSGADGRYAFASLRSGRGLVVAYGGGWHSADLADYRGMQPQNVDVPPGGQAELDLEVVRAPVAEGRVLDQAGTPVAGAFVSVVVTGRHYDAGIGRIEAPSTTTAADGTYRLDGLVATLEQRLEVLAPGWAYVLSEAFRPDVGERVAVDVTLPPPRWLEARVLSSADDAPIGGATVRLRWQLAFRGYPRTAAGAETDGDGRALVGRLPPGPLDLEVEAPGFVKHAGALEDTGPGVIEYTVRLEPGFVIAGRVEREDGVPFPDVWVTAVQGDDIGHDAPTGDDGSFRFDGLGPGTWKIRVQGNGGSLLAELDVAAGTEDLVVLAKGDIAPALVVHVLDPDGEPVPRFEVMAAAAFMSTWGDATDGRYELEAGHGFAYLMIRKARTADDEPLSYAPAIVGPLGPQTEITVRLEPGLEIHGVVRGPDGDPAPGLDVYASPLDVPDTGRVDLGGSQAKAQTDEAGAFALHGLGAGRYRVGVGVPSRYAPVDRVVVDAGTRGVEIELDAATQVRPTVVDPDGNPVSGVRVQVCRRSGGGLCWEQTDTQGEVLLVGLHAEGRYRLEVRPPAGRLDLGYVEIRAWTPSNDPLVLPAASTIRGRVIDAKGAPVEGATVIGRADMPRVHYPSTETAADGTFTLGHLPAGPRDLIAVKWTDPPLRSPIQQATAGVDGVVLVVSEGRELVVRFEKAPASLAGQTVILTHPDWQEANCETTVDPDGTATFRVDPETTYLLHVHDEDAGLQVWAPEIAGDAREVKLAFAPALSITGRVHLPAHARRPYVRIEKRGIHSRTRAASDGTFTLNGLPPGTWTVTASRSSEAGKVRAEAKVKAGGSVELDLR